MPASSRKQQALMAIAEHSPDRLLARNRGVLKMSHRQLHDFASTSFKRQRGNGGGKPKGVSRYG